MGVSGMVWLLLLQLASVKGQFQDNGLPGSALQHGSSQFGKTLDSKLNNINSLGFGDPFPAFAGQSPNAFSNSLPANPFGSPSGRFAFPARRGANAFSFPSGAGFGNPGRRPVQVATDASAASSDPVQQQNLAVTTPRPESLAAASIASTPFPIPPSPNPNTPLLLPTAESGIVLTTPSTNPAPQPTKPDASNIAALSLTPVSTGSQRSQTATGPIFSGSKNRVSSQAFQPFNNRQQNQRSFSHGNAFSDANSLSKQFAGDINVSMFAPKQSSSAFSFGQNGLSGSGSNQNGGAGNTVTGSFGSNGGSSLFGSGAGQGLGTSSLSGLSNKAGLMSPAFSQGGQGFGNALNGGGFSPAFSAGNSGIKGTAFTPFSFSRPSGTASPSNNFFQPGSFMANSLGNAFQNNQPQSSFPQMPKTNFNMFSGSPFSSNVAPAKQNSDGASDPDQSSQGSAPSAFPFAFSPSLSFPNQFGSQGNNQAPGTASNSGFGGSQAQPFNPFGSSGQFQPFPTGTGFVGQGNPGLGKLTPGFGQTPQLVSSNLAPGLPQFPQSATDQKSTTGAAAPAAGGVQPSGPGSQTGVSSLLPSANSLPQGPAITTFQGAPTSNPQIFSALTTPMTPAAGQSGSDLGSRPSYNLGDIPSIVSYGLPKVPEGPSGEVVDLDRNSYVDEPAVGFPGNAFSGGFGAAPFASGSNSLPSINQAAGPAGFSGNKGQVQPLRNRVESVSYQGRQDLPNGQQAGNPNNDPKRASRLGSSNASGRPASANQAGVQQARRPSPNQASTSTNTRPSTNANGASGRLLAAPGSGRAQGSGSVGQRNIAVPSSGRAGQRPGSTPNGQPARRTASGTSGSPAGRADHSTVRKDTDGNNNFASNQCFQPVDLSASYQLSNSSKGFPGSAVRKELDRRPSLRQAMTVSSSALPSHEMLTDTLLGDSARTYNKTSYNGAVTPVAMSVICPVRNSPLRQFRFEGGTCWTLYPAGNPTSFTRCAKTDCPACNTPRQGLTKCTEDYAWLWVWAYCPSSTSSSSFFSFSSSPEVIRQVPLYLPIHCSAKVFPC